MRIILITFVYILFLCVSSTAFAEPVDINSASAKTLARTIQGIGLVKAKAIVAYRKEFGSFDEVDDLIEVKGMYLWIIDRNREKLVAKKTSRFGSQQ